MNLSVRATEMLKLVSLELSFFAVMNDIMSGWSTRRMPMLAPRLVPPCLIVSVAALKTSMNEMGPLETPAVLLTESLAGLSREKLNPVPPPLLWDTNPFARYACLFGTVRSTTLLLPAGTIFWTLTKKCPSSSGSSWSREDAPPSAAMRLASTALNLSDSTLESNPTFSLKHSNPATVHTVSLEPALAVGIPT